MSSEWTYLEVDMEDAVLYEVCTVLLYFLCMQ